MSEESGDLLNKYLKDEFAREIINVSNSLQRFKTISNTHTNISVHKHIQNPKTCKNLQLLT